MKSISARSFVLFNEQLAAMVGLDLPLPESLRRASEEIGDRRLAKTVAELAREVEKGSSLSEAVKRHQGELPELYGALVKAGEAGGNLAEALRRMSSYSHDMLLLKEKAKASLIYPAMLAGAFFLISALFIFYVMPSFEAIFMAFGPWLLPLPTRFVLGFAGLFVHHLAALVVLLGLLAAAAYRWRRPLRDRWQAFELRLPVWGDFIVSTMISRACATLSLLLKSGVPLADALTLAAATADNIVLRSALASAQRAVTRGEKAGAALAKTGVFPRTFTWLLGAAEARGDFEDCLKATADYHGRRADQLGRAMALFAGPAFIVFWGVTYGAVIIALFMPMFGLGELASR